MKTVRTKLFIFQSNIGNGEDADDVDIDDVDEAS